MTQLLPLWLIILIAILVGFSIIAVIYKILAYRKINIAAKKMDFLIEDMIYKSEYVTPVLEKIVKSSDNNEILKKLDSIIKKENNKELPLKKDSKKETKKIENEIKKKELFRESK